MFKRTIRNYKSVSDVNCGNPTCAAEIQIPEQYKVTLKDEPLLLYDSGYGDYNRIIIFSNPRFFSILKESSNWYADGTFKVVPEFFFNYIPYTLKKMGSFIFVFLLYYPIKAKLPTISF